MTWRGRTTPKDRIWACLTYLLPLYGVAPFGSFLFFLLPPLAVLFSPFFLLRGIFARGSIAGIGVVELVIFFALYLGVVQNHRLPHFLRFNALQAILLDIFVVLCSAVLNLLGLSAPLFSGLTPTAIAGSGIFLVAILLSVIFVAVVAASVYAIAQSARGQYAEMPVISESAYRMLP